MFDDEYYQRWEVTRQNKPRYVLRHGVLMWTLVGMVFYVIELDFSVEGFTWLGLLLRIIASASVGWLLGHLSYQRRERIYQRYINEDR